ncbi:antirestriction protein ArdA [Caulobacter segnis]|uniref:Antirestriction ArdA family protein n=2 Tax=Caulobacter segnis TaxID=88688 RepID=D5VKB2_CAUST|nr:antirestriction protein ArdA [Caulobacter segnis]ADG10935.1 Antirestriction ArdA family protein [Caulobacter segnis ATCC 21756]AVQ02628.1 antirestriction protein ArdA [Caulobacter segnis]
MTSAFERLEPRIYVACLAAYNSGWLHGAWIEVEGDEAAVWSAIGAMLKASPVAGAEEFAIHDHEGFGGVEIGEHASIGRVVEIAAFLRARGALGALVLAELGGDLGAAAAALDAQYHGVFDSLADCFQALTEETVDIPAPLRLYIDYEAMARDARLNGEVFTVETAPGAVHVFWSR